MGIHAYNNSLVCILSAACVKLPRNTYDLCKNVYVNINGTSLWSLYSDSVIDYTYVFFFILLNPRWYQISIIIYSLTGRLNDIYYNNMYSREYYFSF